MKINATQKDALSNIKDNGASANVHHQTAKSLLTKGLIEERARGGGYKLTADGRKALKN